MKQIEALTAAADGLTPSDEDMFDLDPDESAGTAAAMESARRSDDMATLRIGILNAITKATEIWSADAEMAGVSLTVFQHRHKQCNMA